MGIKNLTNYLRRFAPKSFAGQPIAFEESVPVAIDVALFANKFSYALGPQNVYSSFLKFRTNLLQANMKPIWVFDGQPLHLKFDERVRRAKNKSTFQQNRLDNPGTYFVVNEVNTEDKKTMYKNLKELLENEDEVYISKFEGEALCSYLVKQGKAFAAISSDSDLFAYLCPRMIFDCTIGISNARILNMQEILNELEISEAQFQKFCILCGSDFMTNVAGTGPVAAFKHAKNGTFPQDIDSETYEKIKNLFETCCYETLT